MGASFNGRTVVSKTTNVGPIPTAPATKNRAGLVPAQFFVAKAGIGQRRGLGNRARFPVSESIEDRGSSKNVEEQHFVRFLPPRRIKPDGIVLFAALVHNRVSRVEPRNVK